MTEEQFVNLAKIASEVPDFMKTSGKIKAIFDLNSADVEFLDAPPSSQAIIIQIRKGEINRVIIRG